MSPTDRFIGKSIRTLSQSSPELTIETLAPDSVRVNMRFEPRNAKEASQWKSFSVQAYELAMSITSGTIRHIDISCVPLPDTGDHLPDAEMLERAGGDGAYSLPWQNIHYSCWARIIESLSDIVDTTSGTTES